MVCTVHNLLVTQHNMLDASTRPSRPRKVRRLEKRFACTSITPFLPNTLRTVMIGPDLS